MKRNRLVGVVFAWLILYSVTASNAQDLTRYEIIERYRKSVVKIERWEIGENERSWSGSGFFYTKTRIITNAHIVGSLADSAEEFRAIHTNEDIARAIYWVVFEGKKYKARFVGRDPDADIAVLETIEEISGIIPASLGNSDNVKIGHLVLIIGSPHGFQGSVAD